MSKFIRVSVNGEALAEFPATSKGNNQCLKLLKMLRDEQHSHPYFQGDAYLQQLIDRSRKAIKATSNPEGTVVHTLSGEDREAAKPKGVRPPELMCVATQIIER